MGAVYALLAYGLWGILPVYWKALAAVPADQIIAWRVVGTVVFSSLLLAALGRSRELTAIARSRRDVARLGLGGLLIVVNWLVYVWAVNHDQLLEASFGYYLNPLISVFLGRVALGERLSNAQGAAIALAAVGVTVLGIQFEGLPWVSLTLAVSFALYGLLHKLGDTLPIPSLAFETAVTAPLAALYLGAVVNPPGGELHALPGAQTSLLLLAGPATALPLLWFASAARTLRLSTLGLFQYLAPSIGFVLALFVYDEPWSGTHAIAFSCIWIALALFSLDAWRRSES